MEVSAVFTGGWESKDVNEVLSAHYCTFLTLNNLAVGIKEYLFDELSSFERFILWIVLRALLLLEPEFSGNESLFADVSFFVRCKSELYSLLLCWDWRLKQDKVGYQLSIVNEACRFWVHVPNHLHILAHFFLLEHLGQSSSLSLETLRVVLAGPEVLVEELDINLVIFACFEIFEELKFIGWASKLWNTEAAGSYLFKRWVLGRGRSDIV